MVNLYIVSTRVASGKSIVALGIAHRLAGAGKKIAFAKPFVAKPVKVEGQDVDQDVLSIMETLPNQFSLELLLPVIATEKKVKAVLSGKELDLMKKVQDALKELESMVDLVVMEGPASIDVGSIFGLSVPVVAEKTNASVVLVIRYESSESIDEILFSREVFGPRLVGVVINRVPEFKMDFVEGTVVPFLELQGIKCFACLPQDKVLMSISIADIIESLQGRVLCAHEHIHELVENLMIGAMTVDSALRFFRRQVNKAVVTGGDRPDIQLAALETSTRCLILTGNLHPNPVVVSRAEELGVPMILVGQDTFSAITTLEPLFGRIRIREVGQIERVKTLMAQHFDFDKLYGALGMQ